MPTPYEQCLAGLRSVVAFYRAKGACPCAFPRFGQLTQFDFRKFGTGPVGCHATEIAIGLAAGEGGFYTFVRDAGDVRQLSCGVCGSEIDSRWEQFNIHMDVTTLVYRIVRARPLGLAADPIMPLLQGFFGFSQGDIQRCARGFSREAGFDEMVAYLQATGEP